MSRRQRLVLIVFALLGLCASVYGLYVHYQVLASPGYSSFCDVNGTLNCQQVMESRFGRVYGVPVAAGGAIWASLVLLLAGWGLRRPGPGNTRTAGYIFLCATVGLAAVFYFAYASFFVLQQLCVICLTMYVSVVGTFLVSARAAGAVGQLASGVGADLGAMRRQPATATLALLWLAASVGLVVLFPRDQTASAATAAAAASAPIEALSADELAKWERWLEAQTRVPEMAPSGAVKVRLVKFNDYQCPACRQAWVEHAAVLAKWETRYPGVFSFEYKDFPLEPECGVGNAHPMACESAVAVRLAATKQLSRQMGDWLFEHQETLSRDVVKKGLREIAQIDDFEAQFPKLLPVIREEAALGQRLRVDSTPTFFLNGIKIPSLRPAYLDAAIAFEMRKAGITS